MNVVEKHINRLPVWLEQIKKYINSCENEDQLQVCWGIIYLLELRYLGCIPYSQLRDHVQSLVSAHEAKKAVLKQPLQQPG